MPSLITHHIFSNHVKDNLKKEIKDNIEKEIDIYHAFAQSHDYLFYYLPDKKIKQFGHYAHHHNTQAYLINIIKYIKENNLKNNNQLLNYLYGSITHYVLDSTCHPYIFYKTGVYRKKEKETKKYRGKHNLIERDLDAIYYEKEYNQKFNKCNINKDIIKNPTFSKELINAINYAYKTTYNKDDIGIYYVKCINLAKLVNTIAINDRLGIKRALYKFIDFITLHHFGYISSYSTHILNPNYNFLNNEKKTWNNPVQEEKKSNQSFDELMDEALKKAILIIENIDTYLNDRKDINLEEIIKDYDYASGLLIKDHKKMTHFEY